MVKAIILASGLAAVAAAAPQFFDEDITIVAPPAPKGWPVAPKGLRPAAKAAPPAPAAVAPIAAIPVPVPVAVEIDGDDYDNYDSYESDDYDYKQKRQIIADAVEGTASVAGDVVSGAASLLGDLASPFADLLGLGYGYDRAAVAALAKRDPQLLQDLIESITSAGSDLLGGAYGVVSGVGSNVAAAASDLTGIPLPEYKEKRQIVGSILNGVANVIDAATDGDDYDYDYNYDGDYDYKHKRQILGNAIDATTSVVSDVASGAASVLGDVLSIPADILGFGGDYGYGYDSKDDADTDVVVVAPGASAVVVDNDKRTIIPDLVSTVADTASDILGLGSYDGDYDYSYDGDYDYKHKRQILGNAIDATTSVVSDVASGAASVLGDVLSIPADILGLGGDYGYGYDSKDDADVDVVVVAPGAGPAVIVDNDKRTIIPDLLSTVANTASDILGLGSDYGYGYDDSDDADVDVVVAPGASAVIVDNDKRTIIPDLLSTVADTASDILGLGYGGDYDYSYDDADVDVVVAPGASAVVVDNDKRQIIADAVEGTASVASDVVSGAASVIGDMLAIPADILGLGGDYGYGYDDKVKRQVIADVVEGTAGVAGDVVSGAASVLGDIASAGADLLGLGDYGYDYKQKRQILGAVADIASDILGTGYDGDYDYSYDGDYDYKHKRQILGGLLSGVGDLVGDLVGTSYNDDADVDVVVVPAAPFGAAPAIIVDNDKRQVIADALEGTASVAGDVVSGAASVLGDLLAVPADLLGLGSYGGYGYGKDDEADVDVVVVAPAVAAAPAGIVAPLTAAAPVAKRQLLGGLLSGLGDVVGDLTGLGGYGYEGYGYDKDDADVDVVVVNPAPVVAVAPGISAPLTASVIAKRQLLGGLLSGVGDLVSDVTGSNRDDDTDVVIIDNTDRPSYCDFHRCGRFGWDYKRSNEKRQIIGNAIETTASVAGDVVSGAASVLGDLLSVPADILGLGDYGYYGKDSDDADVDVVVVPAVAGAAPVIVNTKRQLVGDLVSTVADTASDILGLGYGGDYDYSYDGDYDYKTKRQLSSLLSSLFNPFGLGQTDAEDAADVDVVEIEAPELPEVAEISALPAAPVYDATPAFAPAH